MDNGIKRIVMREWEEKILPPELTSDSKLLQTIVNISDRNGQRIFDILVKSDGRVAIRAKEYVGAFMLKNNKGKDVTLIVEPKIGIRNVIRMLALSEAKNLRELKEIETLLSTAGESIIDLLIIGVVRKFFEKLGDAIVYGFVELPKTVVEEDVIIRGRLKSEDVPKCLLMNPVPKARYLLQTYSTDNIVNRYILDTCYTLYASGVYEMLRLVGEQHYAVARVLFDTDYRPCLHMEKIDATELLSYIPMDRPYIHELLRLVSVIRKYLEKEVIHLGELVSIQAIYINMNDLFEKFVRKMMIIAAKRVRRRRQMNITVRKAGREEEFLVISPKQKVYLDPDIIILLNDEPIAVGDVKYKLVRDPLKSGSEGDRSSVYQVYTYMHGSVSYTHLTLPTTERV